MRKLLALSVWMALVQWLPAQVEQLGPVQFNPVLFYAKRQPAVNRVPSNNSHNAKYLVDSGYAVVTTDTLHLPFVDDFSTDRTPNYLWRQNHIIATYPNVVSPCLLTEGFNVTVGAFVPFQSWTYTWDFVHQIVDSTPQQPLQFTYFGGGPSGCFSNNPTEKIYYPAYYRYTAWDSATGFPTDSIVVGHPDTIVYCPQVVLATGQPGTLWFDNYALINNTYPIDPPTIGVATLDGLNQYGQPYNNSSTSTYGTADYLTSNPIDFSQYSDTDTTIYLSFFFEPQGNGDYPDVLDSLIVEFKDDGGVWNVMWSDTGYSFQGYVPDTFAQVLINVPVVSQAGNVFLGDTGFHTFQFRFRNKASLFGNNNHWNIDYVKLDKNRSSTDTVINDVAFVYPFPTILKNYTQETATQFLNPADLSDSINLIIHNLSPLAFTLPPATQITKSAREVYPNQAIVAGSSVSINAGPSNTVQVIPSVEYHIPAAPVDSFVINSTAYFDFLAGNDAILTNDTLHHTQTFGSVMAYDDGSAEKAYGLTGLDLKKFAYEFNLNKPDTLTAFQVMFAQVEGYVGDLVFNFEAWDSLKLGDYTFSDSAVYTLINQTPYYIDSTNGFATYVLDTPIIIPAHFYFGWSQVDERRLQIGYDVNSTLGYPHMFVYTEGVWDSTSVAIPGSPMIRLVLDSAYWGRNSNTVGVIDLTKHTGNLQVFPNPSTGILNLRSGDNYSSLEVTIFDEMGRQVMYLPSVTNQVNINSLANGVYLLNAFNSETGIIYHTKIVKASF